MMRCVYLGLLQGAEALFAAGHDIAAIGLTHRRGQTTLGVAQDTPVLWRPDMNDAEIQRIFIETEAELLLCYLWDRILPKVFIEAFAGALNYHPSMLPQHRGADPYFWTIWSGSEAGVSVIQLETGVDTGPILAQRMVSVPKVANAGELAEILDPIGLELLLEVVGRWQQVGPQIGELQAHDLATLAPHPDEDLLEIRWSWPARRIARLVRAAAPHPGAFTALDIEGELRTLVILSAHESEETIPAELAPGDAVVMKDGVMIQAGDGGLILDGVQLEGEEPRRERGAIIGLFSGERHQRSSL